MSGLEMRLQENHENMATKMINKWNKKAINLNHFFDIKYRKMVADIFKHRKVHQLSNNQGLIFVVGRDTALIHSEPPMTDTRIFVSVLPGTESQIKAREARRAIKIRK